MSNFIDEFNLQNEDSSSSQSQSISQEQISSFSEHIISNGNCPRDENLQDHDRSNQNQDLTLEFNKKRQQFFLGSPHLFPHKSVPEKIDDEISKRNIFQLANSPNQAVMIDFPPCVAENLELSMYQDEEMFEDAPNASIEHSHINSPLVKVNNFILSSQPLSSSQPLIAPLSYENQIESEQSDKEFEQKQNQNQENSPNKRQILLKLDNQILPDLQLNQGHAPDNQSVQHEFGTDSFILEQEEKSENNQNVILESQQYGMNNKTQKANLILQSKQNMKELKLSQKRRKLMECAQQVATEVANHDWEAVSKISQGKVEPYQLYNVNFFWYLISTLFFNNSQDIQLFENIRKQSKTSQKITADIIEKQDPNKTLTIYQTLLQASELVQNSNQVEDILQGLQILQAQNEAFLDEKITNLKQISQQDLIQSFQQQSTQKQKNNCFVDSQFLENNPLAQDLIKISQLEIDYFAIERNRQAQNRIKHQEHPFPWRRDVLAVTVRPNFDGCVICNSEEFDNDRLWCSLCENSVHVACVGENENNVKHHWNREENQLEVLWFCKICIVQNNVNQNIERNGTQLPEIEFRPECYLCKLQGGIMLPTNCLNKLKGRPAQFLNTKWASTITPNSSVSDIIKKEADYQKCLNRLRSQNTDEAEMNSYSQTFVFWVHMSCAFWLPQIQFQKGKPISLKCSLDKQNTHCQVCHSTGGLLVKCCHEELNSNDSIYSQFLDYKAHADSCKNMMHVECARRADFQMDYQHQVEKFQVFCYEHKPYQIDMEKHLLFWERTDSINTFVENYQGLTRQHSDLFKKACESETQVYRDWMEFDLQKLAGIIEQIYFKLPDVAETIKFGRIPSHITHRRLIDFRVVFIESIFDWNLVANRLNCYKEDCQQQYWKFLGKSRELFKKKVISKNNQASYKIIETVSIQVSIQKNGNIGSDPHSSKLKSKKEQDKRSPQLSEGKRKSARVLEKRKATQYEGILETSEEILSQKREYKSNMKLLNRGGYRHVTEPETDFKPTLVKIYDSQFNPAINSYQSIALDKSTCCYCSCEPDQLKTPKRKSFQLGQLQQIVLEQSKSNFSNESGDLNGLNLNFKTGVVRCGKGKDCVKKLPQFHVACCILYDPSFREKKNAKRQWICTYCLASDANKQLTDNLPVDPNDTGYKKEDIQFDMQEIKVTINQQQVECPEDYDMIDNELIEYSSSSSSLDSMQVDDDFARSQHVEEREMSNSRQPAGPASGQSTTFQASKTRRQTSILQMQQEQQRLQQLINESTLKPSEAPKLPSEPRFLIRIPFEYFKDNEMLD